MQRLPWQYRKTILHKLAITGESCAFYNSIPTVCGIIEQRVAYMLHVGTYLMGTTCF